VANVGDIMLDASLYYRELSSERPEAERIGHKLDLEGQRFRLLTLHRAENTDDPRRLAAIFEALNAASDQPLIFPLHPRTKKRLEAEGIGLASHIKVIDPVGFFDMLELEAGASCIVTDSGGVQKEAYFFRRPCVTLRDSTEWVETVQSGWNHLAGADPRLITRALAAAQPGREDGQPYGRGEAAQAILNCLEASL
jgi:UDP-GlcNAc3NAcA epimerase